ncbi:hypothetical protein Tco_1321594 [Tanacetum coccineum]
MFYKYSTSREDSEKGAQGDRKAEVFQVSNDDTAVAQRRLEDKQPEEKTNTDCLVKGQEKVHFGIKVGANIMVIEVPGQKGAESNVAEKKKVNESMKANLRKLLKYKAWLTRRSPVDETHRSRISPEDLQLKVRKRDNSSQSLLFQNMQIQLK